MTTYHIAVIGGTGPQGKGLAYRWARHGHRVVLGSRVRRAGRGGRRRDRRPARRDGAVRRGATNADARRGCRRGACWRCRTTGTTTWSPSLAEQLAGKIVISCVNPLGFDKQGPYGLDVPGGSAAETAAALVPSARRRRRVPPRVGGDAVGRRRSTSTTRTCWSAATTPTPRPSRSSWPAPSPRRDGVDAGRLRIARQLEPLDRRTDQHQQALQDPLRYVASPASDPPTRRLAARHACPALRCGRRRAQTGACAADVRVGRAGPGRCAVRGVAGDLVAWRRRRRPCVGSRRPLAAAASAALSLTTGALSWA